MEQGVCPLCKRNVYKNEFRDVISRKVIRNIWLMETCRDDIFG